MIKNQLADYFEFLDELRAEGSINMIGARPYLAEAFGLDKGESASVMAQWMRTFDKAKSAAERAVETLTI